MKKTLLLIALALITTVGYSQKKKKSGSNSKTTSEVLAKTDNLSAELVKNEFHLYLNEGGKKEVLFTRPIDAKRKLSECKITSFKAKDTQLYYISWIEKGTVKTNLKTEDITSVVSEIWEVSTKTQVAANTQTTTNITEKVFLDASKEVSETQQRKRSEGSEFKLLPNGDAILKGKAENKYTYDPVTKKYVLAGGKKK
ncbi:hypothetical protein FLJC2902T_15910 [Flavobacterium limnosediminis JC2902]|uniref:Lipoprotein n=1 Tax=Flavobacterium limnosediminis JC2902 TaxID=1341181 RepID=V6SP85_9FLAO|nr:hypothetical protein [Flavobacterium limnosediminis]ESU28244.1 hypothetical protein FLJC2902T_15910 [Flavobacterium limnosediminis JC2902]